MFYLYDTKKSCDLIYYTFKFILYYYVLVLADSVNPDENLRNHHHFKPVPLKSRSPKQSALVRKLTSKSRKILQYYFSHSLDYKRSKSPIQRRRNERIQFCRFLLLLKLIWFQDPNNMI